MAKLDQLPAISSETGGINIRLPQWLVRGIGVVMLGAYLGAGFGGDAVAMRPPKAPPPHVELAPEQIAENFMAENTVRIGAYCSGLLIRDATTGEAVGVETASHCGFRDATPNPIYNAPRFKGGDGKEYIVKNNVWVEEGPDSGHMKYIGQPSEIIVPADETTMSDQVLAVLPGHTPQEVLADYQKSQLNPKELEKLQSGETIYMAGFPVSQDGDGRGHQELERFNMVYAGQEETSIGSDRFDGPTVVAGVKQNENGAVCSPGASGSVGFIIQNGQPRTVGTLSGYMDLSQPGAREQVERKYPQVDWKSMTAACYFSISSPTETTKVVPDIALIPDPQVETTQQASD